MVAYCGGGISATIDLFLLHRLGYDNLTLYDGSMGEWAKDTSLPIETVRRLFALAVIPRLTRAIHARYTKRRSISHHPVKTAMTGLSLSDSD